MNVIELGKENSLANVFLSEIRDKIIQKDSMRFRKNMKRLGEIFAYEISKKLDYETRPVQTPFGVSEMKLLKQQPVIASILRAGLTLHDGVLSYFDKADSAFISAYRKHDSNTQFHIELEYMASPDLSGRVLILADPMLATGSSLELSYKKIVESMKPKHTHFVSVVASKNAIEHISAHLNEKATIWTVGIDEKLTPEYYIFPGLGDAGDLAFGEKIQH